ncbi:MAG: SUF system Fe-S cluster assembly protein [Alphaproteobacteria bacterium]
MPTDALRDFMPTGAGDDAEFRAHAGKPLEPGEAVAPRDIVIEALKTVHDPEIPVNIYDLGLIYELDIHEDGSARVEMTLTAPGCPVAGEMPGMVADAVAGVQGIGEVEVTLTFDPPWTPERMSEEARVALDMW